MHAYSRAHPDSHFHRIGRSPPLPPSLPLPPSIPRVRDGDGERRDFCTRGESRDFFTERLLRIRQFRRIIRLIVRGLNGLWPHKRTAKTIAEVWAAWKYNCRLLALAKILYFDVLHIRNRARWGMPFASLRLVACNVACNKINKYSHELSSKPPNIARRNSTLVVQQRSTYHEPDPRGRK
jgi:hypothetical protein